MHMRIDGCSTVEISTSIMFATVLQQCQTCGVHMASFANVIPWIKYEAQNMMELTWRHELQCIREDNHIQYVVAMLMWFC